MQANLVVILRGWENNDANNLHQPQNQCKFVWRSFCPGQALNTLRASAASCCSAEQWGRQLGAPAYWFLWGRHSKLIQVVALCAGEDVTRCVHAGQRSGFFLGGQLITPTNVRLHLSFSYGPHPAASWPQGVLERLPAVSGKRLGYTHKLTVCHRATQRDKP